MIQNPPENVVGVASHALFASLGAAKKAGWIVRTGNAGPRDWVHYFAYISHEALGISAYLVSRDANWERVDAKRRALEWINNHEANDQAQGRTTMAI